MSNPAASPRASDSQPIKIYDLAIVGGGPTGLFAAFYAGIREMDTVLIDSLEELGGQLTALYPEKNIFDVAGFPQVRAKELVDRLVKQMKSTEHPPTIQLGTQVGLLTGGNSETNGIFTLNTDKGLIWAKSVVVAAGIGAFKPKSLPIPGIEALEGKYVHYSVKETSRFKDQRVLIIGGGDSAVDWANHLAGVAASVHLIHRRDEFRAHEAAVTQMKAGPTKVMTPYELRSVEGDESGLRTVTVFHNQTKQETPLGVDHILVNIGFLSSIGPIAEWGMDLVKGKVVVDSRMATTRPGVFAAGDVVSYNGKLALIACGFADAVTAVCHAKMFIDPKAKLFPGHSSEK
jgi:thioredoxin reductase (NADPH)